MYSKTRYTVMQINNVSNELIAKLPPNTGFVTPAPGNMTHMRTRKWKVSE